jgi:hypothetical protein
MINMLNHGLVRLYNLTAMHVQVSTGNLVAQGGKVTMLQEPIASRVVVLPTPILHQNNTKPEINIESPYTQSTGHATHKIRAQKTGNTKSV